MKRSATVTSYFEDGDTVPMIRLRGKWIERAGFSEGQRFRIEISAGTLTLTTVEPPRRQSRRGNHRTSRKATSRVFP